MHVRGSTLDRRFRADGDGVEDGLDIPPLREPPADRRGDDPMTLRRNTRGGFEHVPKTKAMGLRVHAVLCRVNGVTSCLVAPGE